MSSQPPSGGGNPQGASLPPPGPPNDSKTSVLGLSFKAAGALCYLPYCCCFLNLIACVLWLATEPRDSRFVRFHALQGLLLLALDIVVSFVFRLLGVGARLGVMVGTGSELAGAGVGLFAVLFGFFIAILLLVVHVVAMFMAGQGKIWKLPIIGDLADKNA